jgi:hypothetical protein
LLRRLFPHDPAIVEQVLDVSVTHRDHPTPAEITELLAQAVLDPVVLAVFRSAVQRRQRRFGGDLRWPSLLEHRQLGT